MKKVSDDKNVFISEIMVRKEVNDIFEEYNFLSKTTIMKKVSDEKKVFRSEIMV